MIPEEDFGPSWLRDYGAIEADIQRMEEFAATLRAEVMNNYVPHRDLLAEDMIAPVPHPHPGFAELVGFLQHHQEAQLNTVNAVFFHGDETGGFANAATRISENYGASDAFARARVGVVEQALDSSTSVLPRGQGAPPSGPTGNGTSPTNSTTDPVEH